MESDLELSAEQYAKLIEHRGGCYCCISPPCSACSDPMTVEEAIELGFIDEPKCSPILFVAPMVRAILADIKTQTRRVVKPRDYNWMDEHQGLREPCNAIRCPSGQSGNRLWVKETFYAFGRWETRFNAKKGRDEWHFVDMTLESGHAYIYAADGNVPIPMRGRRDAGTTPGWWKRPAIFMPRRASRITLEITGVRVERLQDISVADAMAEGVIESAPYLRGLEPCMEWRYAYEDLWRSINGSGPGSWDANPWVWAIGFKRIAQ